MTLFVLAQHVLFHHRGFVEGSLPQVRKFLRKKGFKVLELNYSIRDHYRCDFFLYTLSEDKQKLNPFIGSSLLTSFSLLRWLLEFVNTLITLFRNRDNKIVYIGADPLNGLAGCLGKKMGWVDYAITYSVDYAEKRFENNLLNFSYHFIDRLDMRFSDEVWGVSSRIVDLRSSQGIADSKSCRMPNSAFFNSVSRLDYEQLDPHKLVIVSTISKAVDFEPVIDALAILEKDFPDIKLAFIGDGDSKSELVQYVESKGLQEKVQFLGYLDHDKVYEVFVSSGIGLAPYTGEAPWSHYCDPMKVYDYLASGLPVLITDVPALADEIVERGAGEIFELDLPESLAEKVRKISANENYYKTYRKNAIDMARFYDKQKLLEDWLERMNG